MDIMLLWIGRFAGVCGALLCAGVMLFRLRGIFFIGGFQVGTLFQFGIAAMVFACACFLAYLTNGARKTG